LASSKKYSVNSRFRPPGDKKERPSTGMAGSAGMPTAASTVGLMSMLATNRSSVVPGARRPGQRAKNGTWMDSV
jgi:hypothetical protein